MQVQLMTVSQLQQVSCSMSTPTSATPAVQREISLMMGTEAGSIRWMKVLPCKPALHRYLVRQSL